MCSMPVWSCCERRIICCGQLKLMSGWLWHVSCFVLWSCGWFTSTFIDSVDVWFHMIDLLLSPFQNTHWHFVQLKGEQVTLRLISWEEPPVQSMNSYRQLWVLMLSSESGSFLFIYTSFMSQYTCFHGNTTVLRSKLLFSFISPIFPVSQQTTH